MNNTRKERVEDILELKGKIYGSQIFGELNKAWVTGTIEDEFSFSHEYMLEKFYANRIGVKRRSGSVDHIPIIVPEILINEFKGVSVKGKYVELGGDFRSYPKIYEDNRSHLEKYFLVRMIKTCEKNEINEVCDINVIYLEGCIARKPVYRETIFGKKITELFLRVNRQNLCFDLIPCIAWEREALYASGFCEGDRVRVYGRIQSREYFKRVAPFSEEGVTKETHEISICRIQKVPKIL